MTKIQQLRDMADAEDWRGAISLAASFPRKGKAAKAIMQAHEAIKRPGFQRQLGRDPDELIARGVASLKSQWLSRI